MNRQFTDTILGLVYLGIGALLVLATVLAYEQVYREDITVTLKSGTVGNALLPGSDVKVRGVPVGTVGSINATDEGADVLLRIDKDKTGVIPNDSTARLLPKTMFGERYVSLITTASSGRAIKQGDTLYQDRSHEAVEVEELFDELLPVLQAVQPEKLSSTLSEIATALRGNGADLGETMGKTAAYLRKLNPLVPDMADQLGQLGRVAQNYADAAPDLLSAFDDMTTTSRTLVAQSRQLKDVFASVTSASDTTHGWLQKNEDTIVVLSKKSRKALKAVAPYAAQFPCMFKAVREFIPSMDRTLGKDTNEKGLHVVLNIVPARKAYTTGPTFRTGGKPRCPDGSVPAASANTASGLGDVNSPAENRLISELIAPTRQLEPDEFPEWGSLLLGPVLRNTQVVLR